MDIPDYARWLYGMLEESLVLDILEECAHRPYFISAIDVVQKSGYDPITAPWRLRLIHDLRELNQYLLCDSFRMESLHQARSLIEPDDIMLVFDISAAFYHYQQDPSTWEMLGFELRGRYFRWKACPMGAKTTPWVWQTLVWILARRWSVKFGLRLICFVDDFGIFCKPWQREALTKFIFQEFEAHGLLVQQKKCDTTGEARVLLGMEIDIPRMRF